MSGAKTCRRSYGFLYADQCFFGKRGKFLAGGEQIPKRKNLIEVEGRYLWGTNTRRYLREPEASKYQKEKNEKMLVGIQEW